jgi:ferredoxin-NADP reductase
MVAPPATLPPDLFGKPHADRFLRGLTAFTTALHHAVARDSASPASEPVSAWRTLVVTRRAAPCSDVITLELADPGGAELPPWDPGAHLRIQLPSGRIRHYSLCGPYVVAIRLQPNDASASHEIDESVHPGTELRVRDPRNGFPFAGETRPYFIAGGIGITPILPMIAVAQERSLDWRLVYLGRSRDTMPFLDRLDPSRTDVRVRTGALSPADLLRDAPEGAVVYCCGPPGMIDAVRSAAWADPRIIGFRYERFTPAPIMDGHPFEVELARSGVVLEIPERRSVLDVLRDHVQAPPYGCRLGFCGTCAQRVLSGTVEHRGSLPAADGEMLVCVSRAAEGERLVLDL